MFTTSSTGAKSKSTSLAFSCEFVIIPNSAPMDSETQDLVEKPPPAAAMEAEALKSEYGNSGAGALSRMVVEPAEWIRMLCRELNGSFVFGVVVVYGLSQGFAGSFFRVVSDYYWKDVQRVQPSAVQFFIGFYYLPWIMKPIWGLLTDVVSVRGYRRRPYFVAAGNELPSFTLFFPRKNPSFYLFPEQENGAELKVQYRQAFSGWRRRS